MLRKILSLVYKQRLGMEVGGEANVLLTQSEKAEPKDVRSYSNKFSKGR